MYKIIDPPDTGNFGTASKSLLDSYRKWFLGNIEARMKMLRDQFTHADDLDFTPGSLITLDSWLSENVVSVKRRSVFLAIGKQLLPEDIDSATSLDTTSISLAFDSGVYLGETLRRRNDLLSWNQKGGSKADIDFGQMVLSGGHRLSLNPVRVMITRSLRIVRGQENELDLSELASEWDELLLRQ